MVRSGVPPITGPLSLGGGGTEPGDLGHVGRLGGKGLIEQRAQVGHVLRDSGNSGGNGSADSSNSIGKGRQGGLQVRDLGEDLWIRHLVDIHGDGAVPEGHRSILQEGARSLHDNSVPSS
jgi:hypothetical protein